MKTMDFVITTILVVGAIVCTVMLIWTLGTAHAEKTYCEEMSGGIYMNKVCFKKDAIIKVYK